MDTIKIKAKPLNGENSQYCKLRNGVYSFQGTYEDLLAKNKAMCKKKALFVVEGIDDAQGEYNAREWAISRVDYAFCGAFDRYSVTNFKKLA